MRICFATNNRNKIQEVQALVPKEIALVSLHDIGCEEELPETKETLEENSEQKARYVFDHFKTVCFADDSGLEVEALNGAPGVFSARYGGPQRKDDDNIQLLLKNLQRCDDRKAHFRTVITIIGLENKPVFFEGKISGIIQREKKGNNGFGYDPVFIPEGYSQTFAEMNMRQKNTISHRAIAVQKLVEYLNVFIKNR